jgi:hypothetical protein
MEIYTQPRDLQINVANLKNGGWGFLIARGPEHRFKPIVSCYETPLESKQLAVDTCIQVITNICSICKEHLLEPSDFFHQLIKKTDGSIAPEEEWQVLHQRYIKWIKGQLLSESGCANTWEMT